MEYRPFYMAREWVRHGHEVTIVAASHSHVRTLNPVMRGRIHEEHIEGVRYIWLNTPKYNGNGIPRTINMGAFVCALLKRAAYFKKSVRPDVVIASSTYPLDNVAARRIAIRCGAKLVYEVHDLWPLSPIELGGMSPRHPFIRIMQWAENYAYKYSDRVVSMLPNAKEHMLKHGMAEHKFCYVPNGIDLEEWAPNDVELPELHHQTIARLREEKRFIVGYAGAHGLANALDVVLKAADIMTSKSVEFVLVGQGPEKESLVRQAESLGLGNVHFLPSIPKSAIPSFLGQMDALFIGLKRTPIFRFGISPNKLMDYMMAGKPIIQAIDAGNDMVKDSDCGISIAPETPQALADAITAIMLRNPGERAEMGLRGREYVVKNHDYRILAEKFINTLT